jgi:hypothetical protein
MPLIKSGSRKAVSENISEMVHAGHPQNQAVAAALRNARQYGGKYAAGGFTEPYGQKLLERQQFHGFLHSPVPGRTDKLPITVKGGAYVLPADHVAAIGQGNSLAGANIVNKMFKMGPYGSTQTPLKPARSAPGAHLNLTPRPGKLPGLGSDDGGRRGHAGASTDIIAAGGEIVIPPENIMEKFGDLDHGHKALDQWVIQTRKKHIRQLKKLKPPKKD